MKEEEGVDIFNRDDPFFNDVCIPYSTEQTDVTLKDRVKDIFQNVSLCEDNCAYQSINLTTKKVNCTCYHSEEDVPPKGNYFIDTFLYSTNFPLFKCFAEATDINNLKNSVGFYFFSSLMLIEILSLVIFISCGGFSNISSSLFKLFEENKASCKTVTKTDSTSQSPSSKVLVQKITPKALVLDNNDNLDNCPFSQAQKKDNRNFFKFCLEMILGKIDILNLFFGQGDYDIFIISISLFIFSLGTDFFLNALLFSDEVISERYQNQGDLDYGTTLFLNYISNFIGFIIVYVISKLTYFAQPLELMAKECGKHNFFFHNFRKIMRIIKVKAYIYFCFVLILNLVYLYFLCSFCAIYHESQWNWFANSFSSFGVSILTNFIISIVITIIRYLGLWVNSEKIYNISLYLNR